MRFFELDDSRYNRDYIPLCDYATKEASYEDALRYLQTGLWPYLAIAECDGYMTDYTGKNLGECRRWCILTKIEYVHLELKASSTAATTPESSGIETGVGDPCKSGVSPTFLTSAGFALLALLAVVAYTTLLLTTFHR